MTSRELVVIEQEPQEVVVRGRAAARELTNIVSSRKKKLVLAGNQYLFFEDWQTIGKFYGATARVTHSEELREEGKLIGFLATAVVLVNGQEISGADGECTFDEPNWTNKPRFQLRSMAQTRACSKALRNCLGWVAVLAGYSATPAEEMGDIIPDSSSTKGYPEHWCEIHQAEFFKKGRMKGFAHKIEDTAEWCNEEDQQDSTPEAPSPKSSPPEEEPEPSVLVTPDTLVKLEKKIVDSGYTAKEANGIMINKLKWPQITGWSKLSEDQAIFLIDYLEKHPKKIEPENIPF